MNKTIRPARGDWPGGAQVWCREKKWKRPRHDQDRRGDTEGPEVEKKIILGDGRQVSNRVLEGGGLQCNLPV